jgi:HK97 family phage major capsid protein
MTTPFNTAGSEKAFHLDVRGVAPKDIVPEAFILQVATRAGAVEGDEPAVLVPFLSLEDAPDYVAEANAIDESDPDDSQVVIHTGKLGLLVPISREQLGIEDTATLLSDAVRRAMVRKANRAFLAQAAPTPPATTPPAGILNQGITSINTSIQTAQSLDPVIDAVATIEDAGGVASHILASPQSWAYLSKLKDGNDLPLIGSGTNAGPRTLQSLPVLVDRDVTEWSLVVLDKRAILSVYGQILVARSEDYGFNKDVVYVRATWRAGQQVSDVNRVILVPVLDLS